MAQHEFTAEQNRSFKSLSAALIGFAGAAGTLAALMLVYGLVALNSGHFGAPVMVLIITSSGVALVMAWQFTRPLDNFRAITTQTGRDMSELATALDDLSRAFNVFLILVLLWLVVDVAGIALVRDLL